MISLRPLILSGREVWPLIEGGKGISVSNGLSSGAWAATGGIGTFSGVNGDYIDERGRPVRGDTLLILLNAHPEETPFTLPSIGPRTAWLRVIDTIAARTPKCW